MNDSVYAQATVEADKKFGRIARRTRLFHRKNIWCVETSPTNRNDERLSQLSDHVAGEFPRDLLRVDYNNIIYRIIFFYREPKNFFEKTRIFSNFLSSFVFTKNFLECSLYKFLTILLGLRYKDN